MDKFSVNQLAKLAGVSVRTLHHYDHIGLLKPSVRSASNYRCYGKAALLRLQQILLYKELDIPLRQIVEILDNPGFDTEEALHIHKGELLKRKDRMEQLLKTIDNTIIQLKTKKMNYEDIYRGFSKEQAEAYEKEAKERWGKEVVEEQKQRMMKKSKREWAALLKEGEQISHDLAAIMHLNVKDAKVQEVIKRHYAIIGEHYSINPERYKGLAALYVTDARFTAYYDKVKPGLAAFLNKAMLYFCETL